MVESEEELKSLLTRVKEESEKAGFKLNIQKTMIMASGTITSWQTDGKTMETVTDFIFLAPVSLQKVTAIKRCLLLGRKAINKPRQCIKKQRHYFVNKGPSRSKLWFFQWSCMDVRVGP